MTEHQRTSDQNEYGHCPASHTVYAYRCQPLVKSVESLVTWVRNECERVAESGRLRVNNAILGDEAGKKPAVEYRACGRLSYQNAASQVSSLYR